MDDLNKYRLLYKDSNKAYMPGPSWTSIKEFIPDQLMNSKSKFIPWIIEEIGTGGEIRTHDSRIKSPLL